MLNNPLLLAIWQQSRVWLIVVTVLLLMVVGLSLYRAQLVEPETARLQQQKAALQEQLRKRQAEQKQSGVPVSVVEQRETELKQFAEMIPPKQKFSNFIGELFYLSDQAKLQIREISYRPKLDKESKYLNYGLSFSVQGTYPQLKQFVHLLESSKRILFVDKLALTGKRDQSNQSLVNLQIELTTLFQEGAQ